MPVHTLDEIRNATNKAWVLGDVRFQQEVKKATGRSASPQQRGGDRKSEKFWEETLSKLEKH